MRLTLLRLYGARTLRFSVAVDSIIFRHFEDGKAEASFIIKRKVRTTRDRGGACRPRGRLLCSR